MFWTNLSYLFNQLHVNFYFLWRRLFACTLLWLFFFCHSIVYIIGTKIVVNMFCFFWNKSSRDKNASLPWYFASVVAYVDAGLSSLNQFNLCFRLENIHCIKFRLFSESGLVCPDLKHKWSNEILFFVMLTFPVHRCNSPHSPIMLKEAGFSGRHDTDNPYSSF